VPLVPHSDELGALACATAGATRALSDWCGLAHSAPTSDVQCRRSSAGAAAPATASATLLRTRRSMANLNTQSATTQARIRDQGAHARNVCCLDGSDDSHRRRASILA